MAIQQKGDGMSEKKKPFFKLSELMDIYQRFLPSQVIEQLIAETKQTFYQRLLPPILIVWGFIFQRLNDDHSCDAAWSYLSSEAVQRLREGQKSVTQSVSESTSGYCQARQRLPLSLAQAALRYTGQVLQAEFEVGLWHDMSVNLFDGSTLQLCATGELKSHYGTASNQHGEAHWPLIRVVVGFDLWSGAVNGLAEGAYRTSEQRLAHQLIRELGSGFLHVGDRNFGVYAILQGVVEAGSQAIVRLKGIQARRLGGEGLRPGCDIEVFWSPSEHDDCLAELPTPTICGRLIYTRLEKDGFRPIDLYLFTTLTDSETFLTSEIIALYGCRWRNEIDLRHVKTTLKMESLDGKSVEMVRKELYLGMLAYNLLRGLMGLAAIRVDRHPMELSLSQCWRRTLNTCQSLPQNPGVHEIEQVLEYLLGRLGRCVLPKRKKQRFEPREVWGRPRVFPAIKGSREQARQAALDKLKPIS
jgi:hypothetical protein